MRNRRKREKEKKTNNNNTQHTSGRETYKKREYECLFHLDGIAASQLFSGIDRVWLCHVERVRVTSCKSPYAHYRVCAHRSLVHSSPRSCVCLCAYISKYYLLQRMLCKQYINIVGSRYQTSVKTFVTL